MTQAEKVIARLNEVGYVDNFWAIHNYMLRLGAVIFQLKEDGWVFRGEFGTEANRKNYYYHLVLRPNEHADTCPAEHSSRCTCRPEEGSPIKPAPANMEVVKKILDMPWRDAPAPPKEENHGTPLF